jgi:hypothetical protein
VNQDSNTVHTVYPQQKVSIEWLNDGVPQFPYGVHMEFRTLDWETIDALPQNITQSSTLGGSVEWIVPDTLPFEWTRLKYPGYALLFHY